jgi:peptidoglycan/LPS O-acetylase OafA/YrhL
MAVVLQHFSATAQHATLVTIPSLVPHGYIAVDLFFVLSGFIMSYTYLASFQDRGIAAFGSFLSRRVARIVPLNVSVLLLFILLGEVSIRLFGRNIVYSSDNLLRDLPANMLMLQGVGFGTNLNGPSWSVSTEFAAYLLFPVFVFVVFHRQAVLWATALLVSLAAIVWLEWAPGGAGQETDAITLNVIRCFAEFALGMGTYRLYRRGHNGLIAADTTAFVLIAGCALSMVLRCDLPAILLFPPLILCLAMNRGAAARLMSLRFFHFLGVVSFSIYMIHQVFRVFELEWLRIVHPAPVSGPVALVLAAVGSFSVVPFAWLAYSLIERPGRRLVRSLFTVPRTSSGNHYEDAPRPERIV